MKNKYIYRSRISEKKFREILKHIAQDIETTKIANLTGISRISINKILKNIRILMAKECEKISKFSGEISSSQARLEALLWNRWKLLLLRFARNCEQNGAKRVIGLVLALSLRKEVEAQQIKLQCFYFATLIAVNRRNA